ncbi:hypothetical protein T265_02075 [Opisthorchis viverrini]|uniref:Uncharacterized protein n=1 Tax=Opisthorchis viverrini TaxID=6198 RepID=A0A075AII7_OPIVI|nr:hypothetical protein T265_02075 [Opisthorchis viverrini]KER31704.1 hypothetical protein T265_02075 [Opisthorchis viverrini]
MLFLYTTFRLVSAAGTVELSFEPPSGKLFVGSEDNIKCLVKNPAPSSEEGKISLSAEPEDPELIYLNQITSQVQPPLGHLTYQKAGQTTVTCTWTGNTEPAVIKTLNVQVLASETTNKGAKIRLVHTEYFIITSFLLSIAK